MDVFIIGSGICGLKLAGILSNYKEYNITLVSLDDEFIFYPLVVDMIYSKKANILDVRRFCNERGIRFVNRRIDERSMKKVISEISGNSCTEEIKVIDCTNQQRGILGNEVFTSYSQNIATLKRIIQMNTQCTVTGSGIQAIEIANALNHQKCLSYIESSRQISLHPLIDRCWIKQKDLKYIQNDNKTTRVERGKSALNRGIQPKSAQEASRKARRIAVRILLEREAPNGEKFASRGTMIKYTNRKSRIYLGNTKVKIDGRLADVIRKLYYLYQQRVFYSIKISKLTYLYMLYINLYKYGVIIWENVQRKRE